MMSFGQSGALKGIEEGSSSDEDSSEEESSEKYDRYFKPDQEQLMKEARDHKSLASSNSVLTPLHHIEDRSNERDWHEVVEKEGVSESQYTKTESNKGKKKSLIRLAQDKRKTKYEKDIARLSLNDQNKQESLPDGFTTEERKVSEKPYHENHPPDPKHPNNIDTPKFRPANSRLNISVEEEDLLKTSLQKGTNRDS